MLFLSHLHHMDPRQRQHPLADLLISVILPSVILMKFSGPNALGSIGGLFAALSLPLSWGLYEFVRYKKRNFIAVLGLVSVLLTGGIGLLKLDTAWLAVKEATVPGLIGIAVLISTFTKKPLVRVLIMNPHIFDVEKISARLSESGNQEAFDRRLSRATQFLSGTFFFSSVMNYFLAKLIVSSPAGSTAFNEELGRLTLLSYPVIVLPSLIMTVGLVMYLSRAIRTLTGLSFEEALAQKK